MQGLHFVGGYSPWYVCLSGLDPLRPLIAKYCSNFSPVLQCIIGFAARRLLQARRKRAA